MKELIERCKQKDIVAMSQLYEQYKSTVYKTAFLFTHNHAMSEDITQEVFIRLFKNIHLYKDDYKFEPWLYRIAVNVAKNIIRKSRFWSLVNYDTRELGVADPTNNPSEMAEIKDRSMLVYNHIQKLPHKLKSVIILKYYQDLSQEEIAEVLHVPIGTVKSRINSGISRLKKMLSIEVLADFTEVTIHEAY